MQLRNAPLRGDLGEARTRNSTLKGWWLIPICRRDQMVTLADSATASGTWEAPILLLDESAIYKAH